MFADVSEKKKSKRKKKKKTEKQAENDILGWISTVSCRVGCGWHWCSRSARDWVRVRRRCCAPDEHACSRSPKCLGSDSWERCCSPWQTDDAVCATVARAVQSVVAPRCQTSTRRRWAGADDVAASTANLCSTRRTLLSPQHRVLQQPRDYCCCCCCCCQV